MSEQTATALVFMVYGSLTFWMGYLVGNWRCKTRISAILTSLLPEHRKTNKKGEELPDNSEV